jgi:hypothetical protein
MDNKFSAIDLVQTFSSTLELFVYDNDLYLYDDFHESDEDFDYGIYNIMSLKEAEATGISVDDNLLGIFAEGFVEFLINDDLPYNFNVSHDVIDELEATDYNKWTGILKKNGYDEAANALSETLRMLSGEHSLPVSESDYYVQKDKEIIDKINKVYPKGRTREATGHEVE